MGVVKAGVFQSKKCLWLSLMIWFEPWDPQRVTLIVHQVESLAG